MVHGDLSGQVWILLEDLLEPDLTLTTCIGEYQGRFAGFDNWNYGIQQVEPDMAPPWKRLHFFRKQAPYRDLLVQIGPDHYRVPVSL